MNVKYLGQNSISLWILFSMPIVVMPQAHASSEYLTVGVIWISLVPDEFLQAELILCVCTHMCKFKLDRLCPACKIRLQLCLDFIFDLVGWILLSLLVLFYNMSYIPSKKKKKKKGKSDQLIPSKACNTGDFILSSFLGLVLSKSNKVVTYMCVVGSAAST